MIDLRQTPEHGKFLQRIGWTVMRHSPTGTQLFFRRIPLTPFSILKLQRPRQLPVPWVFDVAKRERAVYLNVEPNDEKQVGVLGGSKFHLHRSPFLPSRTIVVDLSTPERHILADMKAKTRYNIGLSYRNGVGVRVVAGDELIADSWLFDQLFDLQRAKTKQTLELMSKKWLLAQVDAFKSRCFAVFGEYKRTFVAVAFYMTSNDTVFYSHNGSTDVGRRLFAPTFCIWEGMREAKRRKLRWFDFEGIFDERFPNPSWQGFSRFKRGFGGKEVVFPGLFRRWNWSF